MPKTYGNVVKALRGEDIPFSVPVYQNGSLVDDIASATFTYIGADMTAPIEQSATVDGGVISYVLDHDTTTTLDSGLYTYCFKSINTDGLERVTLKGYIIFGDDIFVVPIEPPA
jgi:hypothetical protein